MSITLRVLLIVCSVCTFAYIIRKIRKSQVKIGDISFWVLFSLVLIAVAMMPQIVIVLAELTGIATGVNCVFLIIIFLLLMELFLLSIKVSKMENKIIDLAGEIAIRMEDAPREDIISQEYHKDKK